MKEIIINLQVEGIHCWPKCPFPEVDYLKTPHRHVFHIECRKEVEANDREIEIIKFKHRVLDFIKQTYFDKYHYECDFGTMSCEDIAEQLMETYKLTYCKVLEDGENGACITKRD